MESTLFFLLGWHHYINVSRKMIFHYRNNRSTHHSEKLCDAYRAWVSLLNCSHYYSTTPAFRLRDISERLTRKKKLTQEQVKSKINLPYAHHDDDNCSETGSKEGGLFFSRSC
jgi:hypothetical protein